ncbi:MAG TPA: DUF3341 domain-containing protein [Thermoanaerobaculia bacterium]|nr:DUF3341 domain-containing protein [Thermoanaerobaculia bacterium]
MIYGLLAEFDNVESLQRAAADLLIRGYRHVRIYTPYPVKEVSGLFASPIARLKTFSISPLVFAGGFGGAVVAYFIQWYANVIDYPLNVGGRPFNSWPAFIPITFETTILGAALAAAVAFLILNSLPQFHHPLFNSARFERATQDRFFICVEKRDGKYDQAFDVLRKHTSFLEEVRE